MSFRTEVTIPVTRDPRTFEQRREDMVTKLEKSYKTSSTTSSATTGDDRTTVTSLKSEASSTAGGGNRGVTESSWDFQRNRWIEGARQTFDMDVQKMRRDMFALEPMDEFDLDNWDNFGGLTGFANQPTLGGSGSMMDQMERRMQAMREQMGNSLRISGGPMVPSGFPSGGHHNVSSHFSSSSTRTVNDGGLVTQSSSNTQESRQTINGVSTGTKSHSASTNVGAGDTVLTDRPIGGGAIVPTGSAGSMGGVMDFLTNAYEVGDDGLVHFKLHFDAKDFAASDIEVSTAGNRLTVHAKKTVVTGGSSSSREFSRTVDLPRSIDHEKFQCSLTQDGVLILDAPVNAPDYSSITFDSGHNLSIRPKDSSRLTNFETQVSIQGQSGPLVLNDGAGGRKLHLEVLIPNEFSAEDISVRMEANKICVSGKHELSEDKSHAGAIGTQSEFKSSKSQEFSRTVEVPETIDPFTVSAVLKNNVLVIEAPLLCTV